MLYCSERANTHIEHGAKGAYREIHSYNRYLQPTGIIKRMHTAGSVPDSSLFLYLYCTLKNHFFLYRLGHSLCTRGDQGSS